jgi:hypothetical protein
MESAFLDPPVPLPVGEIDQAVYEIRKAPLERLTDKSWLENWLLLRLGLNNEILHEFPKFLYPWCGHGIMSWQYPSQFSKYLVWLSQRKIGNYVEIGARRGGTFIITVEYLRRFNPIEHALAMDIVEQPIMRAYTKTAEGCSYALLDSKSAEAKTLLQSRYWDLALIDGDHSASGFWSDFAVLRDHSRIVAAHDVASDLFPHLKQFQAAVTRLLPTHKVFSALDQYDEVKARTGKSFLGLVAAEIG